jgi:hypothetical protein
LETLLQETIQEQPQEPVGLIDSSPIEMATGDTGAISE